MKLDQQQYERLRALFLRVAELDAPARQKVIDRECGDEPDLREELEQLLAHSDGSTFELQGIAAGRDSLTNVSTNANASFAADIPDKIGKYAIVRKLGEGGMGTVYEAQQHQPRRTVALKVIKGGVSSPSLLRRFEHESHILGLLQHPCIAQVYEAGTADLGRGPQPFFAMELIRGLPLLEYANTNQLSMRQRLVLLADIGEAVHHAHQKGIIHRDLKPENILVSDDSRPKVLDFGVARVTDADVLATTTPTDVGQIIGTILYMSPEQAEGSPENIDIRTDVHSLGVLLFQLLTDQLPYDVKRKMLHEALRAIREDEPKRVSSIDRSYRGDVDAIVSKALEKDRERRYQSALEFSSDIRRFLNNQPIIARPPSAVYQLRKYAQRHKGVFGALTAAFILLIVGVMGTSFGLFRARQREREALAAKNVSQVARQDAEDARDEADAVVDYLTSMLSSARPDNLGTHVLVTDVLDEAAKTIPQRFGDQPLVEARIREVIGLSYYSLGHYTLAEPHHTAAATIRRTHLGERHPLTLKSINNLARVLMAMGKFGDAGDMHRRNYEITRRVMGEEDPQTLRSMNNLAVVLTQQGRHAEAETLHRKTLDVQRRVLGAEHPETLDSVDNLALALSRLGRNTEAEKLFRDSLEVRRRVLGPEHTQTLSTANYLGAVLSGLGRSAEAEELLAASVETTRRVLGEEHFHTLDSMNGLATVHYRNGRFTQAETLYRKTWEIQQRVLGAEHPATLNTFNNLANATRAQGKNELAGQRYAQMFEIRRRVLGEEHPDTLLSLNNLGVTLYDRGRYEESEECLRNAFESRRRVHGEEHPLTLSSMQSLGTVLAILGRYEEAGDLLERSLELRRRVQGADHRSTLDSMHECAVLLALQGKIDQAAELYQETLVRKRRALGDEHADVASSLTGLAEVLLREGKTREARSMIDEALGIRLAALLEDHPATAYSRSVLGECLTIERQFEEAEPLLLASYERLRVAQGKSGHKTIQALHRIIRLYETMRKPDEVTKYRNMLPGS